MNRTSVKILYHGHSNLEIHTGPHRLQLDPFYNSNPASDVQAELAKPHFILLSHAHFDHVGDAQEIAGRTGATIIANHEIAGYYAKLGVKNVQGMNIGGGCNFPFGRVTMTTALHSSSFADGTYGGLAGGWVIETNGQTIYFAGDTGVFGDMALIGKLWNLDLAILPIGDHYTMSPQHAMVAVEMLKPKLVIPIHFGTFPAIEQDPKAFGANLEKKTGVKTVLLKAGESWELGK